ncbi:MAG TPA: hypothetical protein VMV05_06560, partial [bacterium]|nr:hypothetical protein [bacterium]
QMHEENILFIGWEYASAISYFLSVLIVLFNKSRAKANKALHLVFLLPYAYIANIVILEYLQFGIIGPVLEYFHFDSANWIYNNAP